MANIRSKVWNAFETTLASEMASTADDGQLVTVGPLTALSYVAIEPDSPTQREYIMIGGVSAPMITGLSRYLSGSAAGSGITHPAGSIVRSVSLQQMWEDVHDRIEFYSDHGNHSGLSDDDHANYLNIARHDQLARHIPGDAVPVDDPIASAVGDTISEGVASAVARADHRHGREGFGTPGISTPGDVASPGGALTVARSDHQHGREAAVSDAVVGVALRKTASQAITTATLTEVTFDIEDFDTSGFHSGSLGTITIPSDGKYLVHAQLDTSTNFTQFFTVQRNGVAVAQAAVVEPSDAGAAIHTFGLSRVFDLLAGDVLRIMYSQSTGGSRNVLGGVGTFFGATRLGA